MGRRKRLLTLLAAGVAAVLAFRAVFLVVFIAPGSATLVNTLAYRFSGAPRRGDVVAIEPAAGPGAVFLKRVIALGGESLEIRAGIVLINGARLEEPYLEVPREAWTLSPVKVAAGEVYVMGDDRSQPIEYHRLGRTPISRVLGRAVWGSPP